VLVSHRYKNDFTDHRVKQFQVTTDEHITLRFDRLIIVVTQITDHRVKQFQVTIDEQITHRFDRLIIVVTQIFVVHYYGKL